MPLVEHLYIHIPYCSSKCHYCDFYSVVQKEDNSYFDILLEELKLYDFDYDIKTVYFGGGTPSIFKPKHYNLFFKKLKNLIDLSKVEEITMELNPKDYEKDDFKELYDIGINRLSFGVQSFNEHHLLWLGRVHKKEDAIKSILYAKEAGFENINLDIIFGMPDQTKEEFLEDIKTAVSFEPAHLSFYMLTYYPGTALYSKKDEQKHEDDIALFYELLRKTLKDYIHYEISNFAKKAYESKHNMAYWEYKNYLGLGAGAHSKVEAFMFSNPKDINLYREKVLKKHFSLKAINEEEHKKNKIMMGLRTIKGVDSSLINIPHHLKDFFSEENGRVFIKPEFWLISNSIISEVI